MTAATKDIKTVAYGGEDCPTPVLYSFPVAANTIIYAGTMVATNAAGYAVPASASAALKLWGRAERTIDNRTSNVPFGAAGDLSVEVKPGVFFFVATGSITIADRGALLFAPDDNTVSKLDGAGTYPIAGYMVDLGRTGTPEAGKVAVAVGMARPESLNPSDSASAFKARGVVTVIAAHTASGGVLTGNANGALGTQDGLTPLANQVFLLPAGLANVTAADAGPYIVTTVGDGSTPFVLTRPSWWGHGSVIQQGAVIEIGGEGTLYKGTSFKTFVASGQIVGTNNPVLRPDLVCQEITLTTGNSPAITNVAIHSATKTQFAFNRTTPTGTANTIEYNAVSITPGDLGTASVVLQAQVAAGTVNAADGSVGNFSIQNW